MHKWDAEDYRRHSSVQLAWGRELIAKLALKDTESVLDVGCGDGKVTAEIAATAPNGHVLGIDNSREMISLAVKSYSANRYANLKFRLMDAREIPFENEFDVVFSNAVLHWVKEHRAVLQGIARSLKCPGRILLQMGGRGNVQEMVTAVVELTCLTKWKQYFSGFVSPYRFCGPEEYRIWLEEAGLDPVRVELIQKDMTHKGREGLLGWIRTTWHPFLDRVPDDLRQVFLEEAVDLYLVGHPLGKDGVAHVSAVRLEVEAVKK